MGLIIKNNVVISGTQIELPEIYGRIEFAGRADGKTLEVAVATYASKNAFKQGASVLSTNVPQGSFTVQIQERELQTVETAHEYAKKALEQQDFEVVIDL